MKSLLSFVIGFGCIALLEAVALPVHKKADSIAVLCRSEGRFEDRDDCGSFIECILDKKGRMLAYKRSCHGKAFDVETRTCRKPSKVRGCHMRESRQFYSSMRFNRLCADGKVKYACGDCGTQITCSDGKAYETKCEGQLRCTKDDTNFEGAVCHTKFDDNCRCTSPNSYRQDAYHNGTFFMCKDVDSVPSFYNCPPGMHFNETSKNCLNQDGSPACTEAGLFAYPDNCSRYYMCTYSVEGWLQTKLACETGLLFNEQTKVCENPCDWAEKDFVCEVQGRFRNPRDCSQFYECITDKNNEFLRMTRICPPRHNWSNEFKGCVPASQSDCKVQPEGPIKQCLKDFDAICLNGDGEETEGEPSEVSPPETEPEGTEETEESPSQPEETEESPSQPEEGGNEITENIPGDNAGNLGTPESPESPSNPEEEVSESVEPAPEGSLTPDQPDGPEPDNSQPEEPEPEAPVPEEPVPDEPEPEELVPEEPEPEAPVPEEPVPEEAEPEVPEDEEGEAPQGSVGDGEEEAASADNLVEGNQGEEELFAFPIKRLANRNRSYK